MIKRLLLLCFTFLAFNSFAQPMNDDCSGIIDLGVGPSCDSTVYDNVDATASQIFDPPSNANIPACWDNVNNDVWFQFTVPADGSIVDFTIVLSGDNTMGNSMIQPQLAVYRGECLPNELDELLCAKSEVGETSLELDLLGLTPGLPYFLRVDDYSATATPNWGDFQLCVDTLHQVNTIDEGGSTSCAGELYDTGGPDDDYQNNENNVFTICPPAPNNTCITYTLDYFNVEEFGDAINIYDGDNTGAPLLASIGGGGFGQAVVDGGGGVCFVTQASSGCLTIEFLSDGTGTFEGFSSFWECSTSPCEAPDPVFVDANVTSIDISDAVATPQTIVTVDTIICDQGSYGTFIGDGTDLGLSKGLVLTSGTIDNAVGPNTSGSISSNTTSDGDDDLDFISINYGNGALSNDACIVELDVFVATDELVFEYVFGSDEYPEFVNSTFNDIFAFLISGPGIIGDPGLNNQLNIATLPGTTTQVEINTVNNLMNWEYYRNNEIGQSVEYDGLTSDFLGVKKSLTARADVTPCNEYHLKLAIADRGDSAYDSGVFISEIKGGTPQLSVNFASGIDYLIEGCSGIDDELQVTLNNPQDVAASYGVTISGTATQGVDYILNIPDTIILAPGETLLSYPIIPIIDNLNEGTETIIISLSNNFGCGNINFAEITIELEDAPEVIVNLGQDTAFVCANTGITLNVDGASSYFWTPVSIISDPSSPNPVATPIQDTWVNVIGTVGTCSDQDSIYLQIIDPQISINPITATNICEGETVSLEAVNNVSNQGLVWTPGITLPDPNAQIISDMPAVTTTYTATVEIAGCPVEASITVNVDPFDFPELTTLDTTLCESYFFDLANPIPGTSTTYQWTPNVNMNDNTLPNPTVQATAGVITYTVVATSANAYCTQTASIDVTGVPASAPIANADTMFICLGETVDLFANTTTGGVGFQWLSNPFDPTLTPVTDTMLTITPGITTTYYTELIVGACTVFDSIYVKVDSLPDLSLEVVPLKDIYCFGEIVSLVSPTYEPSSFMDIMHQWNPVSSANSDLENLNLVLVMDETTTYTRVVTNNACSETTTITLEVVEPNLQLSWSDTTICAGEPLVISELLGDDNFVWTSSNGDDYSNETTNILNFTPTSDAQIEVTATISDCEASATADVIVADSPDVFIQSDPGGNVALGTEVTFTAIISNPSPGDQYIWTDLTGQILGSTNPISFTIIEEANQVSVTVINDSGCETTAMLDFAGLIPEYQVPNAFTPDGDGVNDFFNLTFVTKSFDQSLGPIEIVTFSVWNRWGNLVYNNETPDTGWDGMLDGDVATSDVYVFLIQIKLPNGTIQTIQTADGKNDITLIR